MSNPGRPKAPPEVTQSNNTHRDLGIFQMLTNLVLLVDLADYAPSDRIILGGYNSLELERQLRAQVQALPLGAHIKLIVHNFQPFPDAWDFMRTDLKVQVEGSDPWILRDWYELFAGQSVAA